MARGRRVFRKKYTLLVIVMVKMVLAVCAYTGSKNLRGRVTEGDGEKDLWKEKDTTQNWP